MKAFGIVIVVKLLAIVAILVLLGGLQIRFGSGGAMLGLLHVAAIMALVMYRVRSRRTRREKHSLLVVQPPRRTV